MDPITSYLEEIFSRYQSLPEEEKEVLKTIPNTPFAAPLDKIFGPEMGEMFSVIFPREAPAEPTVASTPPQEPMEQPIRRAGLGSR